MQHRHEHRTLQIELITPVFQKSMDDFANADLFPQPLEHQNRPDLSDLRLWIPRPRQQQQCPLGIFR